MVAAYPPDPSVHTDPEIEKRCRYCHPEIFHNQVTRRLLQEAERRQKFNRLVASERNTRSVR